MIKSFFKKYLPFTIGAFETYLAYRVRQFLWFIGEFLQVAILFFLWTAIYKNSPNDTINTFTINDMVFYIIAQRVIFNLTYMDTMDYVADDVIKGTLAMHLIKPINYRIMLFFKGLGDTLISVIFFALPFSIVLIVALNFMNITITVSVFQVIALILSTILALIINYFLSYMFSNIVFYTTNYFGVWQLKRIVEQIFSGALIPLVFFPEWLYKIASILPYMHVQYVPILIMMNRLSEAEMIRALLNQLIWIVILLVITEILWRRAVRKIVILGG